MTQELVYNFLYDIEEFKAKFQRVLARTPKVLAANKVDFWITFFGASVLPIHDSKLNEKIKMQDACILLNKNSNILKLAFKVQNNEKDQVILRSISVSNKDPSSKDMQYSKAEISAIEDYFFVEKHEITKITISSETSKKLNLNPKEHKITLDDNIGTSRDASESHVNIIKVQPLSSSETIGTILDLISNPKNTNAENIGNLYGKLLESRNSIRGIFTSNSESADHGFTYGALVFNYKHKYAIDLYVEHSAGRGFVDLYYLLRKDSQGQTIGDAVKIITEFKRQKNNPLSVKEGEAQMENKAYDQLIGRTTSKKIILASVDFSSIETHKVTYKEITPPIKSFISVLISERQVKLNENSIKENIENIFNSIRSDQSLDKVILGDLLSSVEEINIFYFSSETKRATIFVFKNESEKQIILSVIEEQDSKDYTGILSQDPDKKPKRNQPVEQKKISIKDEVKKVISFIQKKLEINSGKKIQITINPKGKIFSSNQGQPSYYQGITVEDIKGDLSTDKETLYNLNEITIKSKININDLIEKLKSSDLDDTASPSHDQKEGTENQLKAFDTLQEVFLKLNGFITLEKEVKSIVHGLFLHKKFNDKMLRIIPELSVSHGRADLVLVFENDPPIALELGLIGNGATTEKKQIQLSQYIPGLKVITNNNKAIGVSLIFDLSKTARKGKVIIIKSTRSDVDHTTTDEGGNSPNKSNKRKTQDSDNNYNSKKRRPNNCPTTGNKKKREVNSCKISWQDIDEFNIGRNEGNVEKINIDSSKFLIYIQNIQDKDKIEQLLDLAKEKIDRVNNNQHKYLLKQVIEYGGYDNYLQNKQFEEISSNIIIDNSPNINPILKAKIVNAAGRILLFRSLHGTIASCTGDSDVGNCLFSTAELTYSFASQKIETLLVKNTPKFIDKLSSSAGQIVPKIFGINPKFAISRLGTKYGTKMAKGAAEALGGVFDIIDIGLSAKALIACQSRQDGTEKCSDKEIRDNIASISFSSVSFISGVALTAASMPIAGTLVGFGLMVGYGVYSGISDIIEYEKRYDTTHGENWSIFWRSMLFIKPRKDIQELKTRDKIVNEIVKESWDQLKSLPDDVVAYATGLGRTRKDEKCKVMILDKAPSSIHMHKENIDNTENFSRVIPSPIQNSTMICLPSMTNANYEKGKKQSVSTAVYYCDNAVVIIHDKRSKLPNSNSKIIFSLKYINSGEIIGSNKWHNIFSIFEGNPTIKGGNNTINKFVLIDNQFIGNINLGHNSTNIINTQHFLKKTIFSVNTIYEQSTSTMVCSPNKNYPDQTTCTVSKAAGDNSSRIYYVGGSQKSDEINCGSVDDKSIVIDGGGGGSNEPDIITDCQQVIIRPHTKIRGKSGNYIFRVLLDGYENQTSHAEINVQGNGTITFPEINLLQDCDRITYSLEDKTLSFQIPLKQNGTFTLEVKNYLNENKQPNFVLVDKHGSNVIPKIKDNSSTIDQFKLYTEYSLSDIDNLDKVEKHYRNISNTKKNREVFGVVVKNNADEDFPKQMVFASSSRDIINLDEQTIFAKGGEEQDIYITNNGPSNSTITIDNEAQDKKLDVLMIPSTDDIILKREDNNLSLLVTKKVGGSSKEDTILVRDYFIGPRYQHLILVDQNGDSFIPFKQGEGLTLAHFYHADNAHNIFILSLTNKHIVTDSNVEDIKFYKEQDHLILLINHNDTNETTLFIEYFDLNLKSKDLNVYSYNNGQINYDQPENLAQKASNATSYLQSSYKDAVQEYEIDFNQYREIHHNQKKLENNTLVSVSENEEKIGIIIFKNVVLDQIKKIDRSGNDLVIFDGVSSLCLDFHFSNFKSNITIKNWFSNPKYKISKVEFHIGLDRIVINKWNENTNITNSNNELEILHDKIKLATEAGNSPRSCHNNYNYIRRI